MKFLEPQSPEEEKRWIEKALEGDKSALEGLISLHQDWIYQMAYRMTGQQQDAEDAAQEVLIRMVTHLSSFQGKSRFRTWLYRIAVNQIMAMKKGPMEFIFTSLEQHNKIRQMAGEIEFQDPSIPPVERSLLVEETKLKCMMGMLICLDREQRMVFILGGILGVESTWGAELMEISPASFRKKLQRARDHLSHYMNDNCSLMNPKANCVCSHKTKAARDAGFLDQQNGTFHRDYLEETKVFLEEDPRRMEELLDHRAEILFQKQQISAPHEIMDSLMQVMEGREFQDFMEY